MQNIETIGAASCIAGTECGCAQAPVRLRDAPAVDARLQAQGVRLPGISTEPSAFTAAIAPTVSAPSVYDAVPTRSPALNLTLIGTRHSTWSTSSP